MEAREAPLWRLMLDAGMVSGEGVIPKFAEVRDALRAGQSAGNGYGNCNWERMELGEEFYWRAVLELELMSTEELGAWPQVKAEKLRLKF